MGNGIVKGLKYILQCILSVIYDDTGSCVICRVPLEEGAICNVCFEKVNKDEIVHSIKKEDATIECISVGYYSGILKELIIGLKYKSDFRCGRIMADLMHNVITSNNLCYDFICYVPSSKNALKKRGYNQAEYIATLLGEMTGKKVLHCIEKHKETKDQIGLSGSDRWLNLKESFNFLGKDKIKDSLILLIDDVITTGATAFYCSELLLKEGCGKVIILTVAKSTI